ncbi:Ig-like domain-containing protein [Rhodohalobacter sp. 8-1]|uniref:Ig-like domain-containing protein n=1 Tax=Rhodohalobacter sp. 8-1 TaxID=3131972 RepID=UPI0030EB466C
MRNFKLSSIILIALGLLYFTACDNTLNNAPELEDSLELFAGLELIPETEKSTVKINKGTDLHKDGYFKVKVENVLPNKHIQNVETEAWCLEWKKPLRDNNDIHTGVKMFATGNNDKWKPLNYLFSIRHELQANDPDLTYREIQAVVWSLAGYMNIAPEFNLDKLPDSELPSRLRTDGTANFSRDKAKTITQKVLSEYSTSTTMVGGFALQTAANEQDVIIPGDPQPGNDVATISLDPEEGEVKVSETIQLIATFFDADGNEVGCEDTQWSSDDESIATVDSNGEVFGENQGEANISVECDGVTATSSITVEREDIQIPGRDIIVFNDVEPFDQIRLRNPNNVSFIKNLINFSTTGSRNDGDTVLWDCGRNTRFNGCTSGRHINGAQELIKNEGYIFSTINSSSGTLVDIPSNVKSLWLWLPTVAYTVDEINALKQFAAEGGRIVFIGEWDGFYGSQGLAVENQLLINLGAVMRNVGNQVDCGSVVLPGTSIREHPITEDVTNLTIGCASVIELGPDDFPLFYDTTNRFVLAGVAKIETVPITELQNAVSKIAITQSGNTMSTMGE